MNLLTITSLYPNHVEANLGVFIEIRLTQLRESFPEINHTVIAPVPWFPFAGKKFGQYAQYAKVKPQEEKDGVIIYHPRYIVIPKIGMLFTPFFMALSLLKLLFKLKKSGQSFDAIDGHYFYPDGVAIALAAKVLKLPFTITGRGTDLNIIARMPLPKKLIQWAAKKSAQCITVSKALKSVLLEIGVPSSKVTVMRNGVDLNKFTPSIVRDELRQTLKMDKKTIVSVGYLKELKGHHLVIEALQQLRDYQLFIIGSGSWETKLQGLVKELNLEERVFFTGAISQQELVSYFQGADIGVLASSREGWANVLLESMACGTPMVATNVGGNSEIITAPEAGIIVNRTVDDIANGINKIDEAKLNRADTRSFAENFSWQEISTAQFELFTRLIK